MGSEYWILDAEKIKELTTSIQSLGAEILRNIIELRLDGKHPNSIWKLKTTRGWIGLSIEKVENNQRIIFWLSLNREEPIEFTAGLRYWDKNNPSETCVDLFENSYQELDSINISELTTTLIENLKSVPIFP
jgi:hypothetical protein